VDIAGGKSEYLLIEGIGEGRNAFSFFRNYTQVISGGISTVSTFPINCGYQGIPLYGDSVKATFCFPLSVEDLKIQNLSIYPNPTTNYLNINFGNVNNIELFIKVSDIQGRTTYQKAIKKNIQLDCSGWNKGIYFLMITDGLNNYNKKIVVE
jgi:hypothetical protein